MKKFQYSLIYLFLIYITINYLYSQSKLSNTGRDFWLAFMTNDDTPDYLKLFITSRENTSGEVSIPQAGWKQNFNVIANKTTTVDLPVYLIDTKNSEIIEKKGINIKSQADISVFAINNQEYTTDATCVLPVKALGSNTEYIVCSYKGQYDYDSNYQSEFIIVGITDNTEISIIPSVKTINGKAANIPFSIKLNRGETYQVKGYEDYDLSGTTIKSLSQCKSFAVFSGVQCMSLPNCCCCDHLYKQLFPVNTWGKEYIVTPFSGMTLGYLFRVLCSEDNTKIIINGSTNITKNRGEYYEQDILNLQSLSIKADKAVCVSQYMKGSRCNGIPLIGSIGEGDPSMLILNPNNQMINKTTFNTVSTDNINKHFVNIITKTINIDKIKLDNSYIPISKFRTATGNSLYSYSINSISFGSHTIESDSSFIVYSYGYGRDESYLYSGGASFENLSYNFTYSPTNPCVNNLVEFSPTGKIFNSYKWYFSDGDSIFSNTATKQFKQSGKFIVKMVVKLDDNCQSDTIEKTIDIKAAGDLILNDSSICYGAEVELEAKGAFSYIWNTKETGNKIKVIPETTTYYIITATFENGCTATDSLKVTVSEPLEKPNVSNTLPLCAGSDFKLYAEYADNSKVAEYHWKFPDGTETNVQNPEIDVASVKHNGTYSVYCSIDNCKTAKSYLTLIINKKPENFLPETLYTCENDTLTITPSMIFKNYLWEDKSVKPNHQINKAGLYSLSVVDSNDCKGFDSVNVIESCKPLLFIPSAFTPNEDNINDIFLPAIKYVTKYNLYIYNRWGEILFSSDNINEGWNGSFNNTFSPQGVYLYSILIEGYDKGKAIKRKLTGELILLK
ncbi:MAG: gliding motility-associated C-terminal domain-containing protein [Bacteroidales bacterium]|nr:gliding motility-associated C-terminal domain-containing protein [Bacteroidales bacterium]